MKRNASRIISNKYNLDVPEVPAEGRPWEEEAVGRALSYRRY